MNTVSSTKGENDLGKYTKPYVPIIKQKGFNPRPVAGNIPAFADSEANPDIRGTRLYQEFWDEQVDRCLNGYRTGGLDITGRHYFYMNFIPIDGLFGIQYPWFVDLDYEFFKNVEEVKTDHLTGLIYLKARRKGLSEKAQGSILHYGIRFIESYRGAVAAGLETYVKGLRAKFDKTASRVHREMRLNVIQDNDKEYRIGYERADRIGGFVEESYGGHVSWRTMFDNPKKLEGEYFHDVIFEEAGEFPMVYDSYDSILPALEFGAEMLGTYYIYGTGGNILTTSKAFSEMYHNAEQYGLIRVFVSGARMYFPFFGNQYRTSIKDKETGRQVTGMPNFSNFKPWQLIGVEDIKAAEGYIREKRVEYAKLPDKTKLKKHNKNYCLDEEEAFSSGGRNNFDDEVLYSTLLNLESEQLKYFPVVLDWVYITEESGKKLIKFPLEVKWRHAAKNDPEWKHVWVYQLPMPDYRDLDIIGVDGYNQDQSRTSSSLGATTVIRRGNWINLVNEGIHDAEYAVCLYYQRPPRKEQFYEISLMISVWYKAFRNTMINAEQDFVIDFYKKNGGKSYLSKRPVKFDAPSSRQMHEYGAKMTGSSKPQILGILEGFVIDYGRFMVFPPMVRDFMAYDEEFIGTDWDSADAVAYAKMRIEDMRATPRKDPKGGRHTDEPEWVQDKQGYMVIKNPVDDADSDKKKMQLTEGKGGWKPSGKMLSDNQEIDNTGEKRDFTVRVEGEEEED